MNDAIAQTVRRHDPDRFLTALFAPPHKRDDLLVLYAFNHEIARAREVVSEPPLALIRLQWWREVLEGAPRRHEVATPLTDAITRGALVVPDLLPILEAREMEAEPAIGSTDDWWRYVRAGAGGLSVAAARLLSAPDPESFRPFGTAYGVAGLLRSIRSLAAHHRSLLPADLLAEQGLSPEAAIAAPDSPAVRAVAQRLADDARVLLKTATRRVLRPAIAAALPAVLARRDLARWPRVEGQRRVGDKLAVIAAGLTGRV